MFIVSLMLWSCAPPQTPFATNPVPIQASLTPTFNFPTIPPTGTSTNEPSFTATATTSLAIGKLIFYEDFTSNQGWDLRETDRGGSSIYNGRLNLAVRQPNSFFFIPAPAPEQDNFYVEVNLRGEVCEDDDEFGIMFRLEPLYNHYRFSLTCKGLARLSRVIEDQETVLIPPTETYVVFPGIRIENKLAVWASGPQLRFFINDVEVFSSQDKEIMTGGFGLFVRTRHSQQTTVSFDDLWLYAIQPPSTATADPEPNSTP